MAPRISTNSLRLRLRASLVRACPSCGAADPELRCAHCGEWWAITPEFWSLGRWDTCRACERELARLYQALLRRDPTRSATEALRSKENRKHLRRTAPDLLPAYDRERNARHREWQRAYRAKQRSEHELGKEEAA